MKTTSLQSHTQHKRHMQNSTRPTQLHTIFEYLFNHVATVSMVSAATGVSQKNICRYKRDLEKSGQLWETVRTYCQKTGHKAWYITTNPRLAKVKPNQLKLF